MSSGMNVEQAKELASKRNYKWAVGNLKGAYGISYKKATKILLYELAEIADRLVLCKDCKYWKWIDWADEHRCVLRNTAYNALADDYCSYGERKDNE